MKYFWLWIYFVCIASAEYRAYELQIIDKDKKPIRKVINTLDPNQYPGYHPLNPNEQILLLDTWMCWGYTGGRKKICPKPKKQNNLEQKPRTPAEAPQ